VALSPGVRRLDREAYRGQENIYVYMPSSTLFHDVVLHYVNTGTALANSLLLLLLLLDPRGCNLIGIEHDCNYLLCCSDTNNW
jgi:hypothetical protein